MTDSTTAQSPTVTLDQVIASGGQIVFLDNGQLKSFPVSQITDLLKSGMSTDVLGQADSLSMFGQVESFEALRKLKPQKEGARISLRGWNKGSCLGGGEFIGHLVTKDLKARPDDGGMIAAGSGFFWERVCSDCGQMNVTHFGALPGATAATDCVPAMTAMLNWSNANAVGLGIQFPAGTFFASSLKFTKEIGYFRIAGNHINFGYFANTVLVSDATENFMLDVAARRVELANIIFRGVSTTEKPNKKGIFNNIVIGGQYFNMTCVRFEKIGGTCVNLIDTLDTKMTQWYASQCTGDVIVNKWSDRQAGGWNHTTAVEMTNFNIQKCVGGKVFDMQRCAQSFITNGWIEHCDDPGDLSNGQWTVNGLSIEDCKKPLKASYARFIEIQRNLQSGSRIDYSIDPELEEWLSEWERGRLDIANHGIFIDGTLEPGTIMSRNKLSNSSDKAKWFRVGTWYSPSEGDSIDLNLVGTGNFLSVAPKLDDIDGVRQGGGNTLIRVQLKKDSVGATLEPHGSSPLQAAKIAKVGAGKFVIYAQLKPYTRNVIPVIVATGATHYEAGVSYYFRPAIASMSDEEIAAVPDAVVIAEQWSLGQLAGVGATNEGNLMLKSKIVNDHLQVQVMVSQAQWAKPELRYIELKKEAK
ncbi:putative EPS-depolymerase [Erwinia phage vB_EamM_Mortimer]|uniref:Putative EPS-depolymerase n=1 Tax=Erwinia phage vB_EamM_Mortimer TaxID=2060129 RepID=A0A2H5BKI7_9CAUD|nr:putative EPS-depolymerase [Erwinia phage vB_EamM_Mortimer]